MSNTFVTSISRLAAVAVIAPLAFAAVPAQAESPLGARIDPGLYGGPTNAKAWSYFEDEEKAHEMAAAHGKADIVDTAVSAGSFSTLVAAVKAAGLVDTLKGPGPFTVFAPTDEAFAKLPAGTVDELLKPENKAKLVALLTYHVVPGNVTSADLAGRQTEAGTVQGSKVSIDATGSVVKVDEATVIAPDVGASNGVIHVIDTVITPAA